ncbi:hypothetical protein TYRP_007183 [Tyrophagus putrescentiae]|nr:hypothetical protein TYRP_007183 [Tyrophagus putrescentiae]
MAASVCARAVKVRFKGKRREQSLPYGPMSERAATNKNRQREKAQEEEEAGEKNPLQMGNSK